MAYDASKLFSGTWQNIVGSTASWQSDQDDSYRGFTIFSDGYEDENGDSTNEPMISYEGDDYYEWGYVFVDIDLDGIFEINRDLEISLGSEPRDDDYTIVSEGGDKLVGRYFSSTHCDDRPDDNGDWDRNPNSYNGTFSGSDLGIFEIDVELNFSTSEDDDLILGSTNKDTIQGYGGDDILMSRSGNDIVYGGSGKDKIYGGFGKDNLYGGADSDTLYGESGNDYLKGHSGNDTLHGGEGDDHLKGGTGKDKL